MSKSTGDAEYSDGIRAEALGRFHMAFGLMTIIPLLICIYFATVRISSIDILTGLNGVYFVLIIVVALLGLLVGRNVLLGVIERLWATSERLEHSVHQEAALNERLKAEIVARKRVAAVLKRHRELLEEMVRERTNNLEKINRLLREEIVDRRQTEKQLKKTHEELMKSHGDLKSAQLQLIQAAKLESAGRLAAGVAHEVKNPLAVILQGVDYLSKKLRKKEGACGEALNDIRYSVKRADTIIKGLLSVATPGKLNRTRQDINSVVERALLLVKHEAGRHRIKVTKNLKTGLPAVRLDKPKFEQVFVNVLMNAIQATPKNGTLLVKTYVGHAPIPGPGAVSNGAKHSDVREAVIAEIQDSGTGIPKDKLAKIFDPFFTTRPYGKGTGLGLAVTRKIVELHRGRITIENRSEGGAKTTISLETEGGTS